MNELSAPTDGLQKKQAELQLLIAVEFTHIAEFCDDSVLILAWVDCQMPATENIHFMSRIKTEVAINKASLKKKVVSAKGGRI